MLKIYNSLSGRKEAFKPLVPGQVRMYVCGMTVYDYCHIGHARGVMVAFDVITRYLRYKGYQVTYVRNITDVDDKIFKRAAENGEPYQQLTERFIAAMHEDERALGVLPPDLEPRATAHMDQILNMIGTLIAKGYAYAAANGDVYYRIDKFKDYGKLSKRNLEDLRAGARVEIDEAKQSPLDFVLWKAAKPGEAAWESPWGPGRPGWHIECSAMSTCCLGETFDIHGGGPDLKFPHHENEIAQSEAATGKPYVQIWMHAGAVRVDNEKMSKSLGNFFTIRDVLAKYNPEVVRYFLISSHYRSPINYSEENLKQAQQSLERFYTALRQAAVSAGVKGQFVDAERLEAYRNRFIDAMDDDFNTPEALALLFELVKEINKAPDKSAQLVDLLKDLAGLLGLLQQSPEAFLQGTAAPGISAEEVEALIAARNAARAAKEWAKADQLRDELIANGILLDDGREGTSWRRQST
ncbi:MAG: cysteine--tRNA ligase [Pseudomonadales bacterium]|nr:cysteine--tRNA ligase [Pseudomonadales bacterium]